MGTSEQAETRKELTRIQRLLFIGPPNFSRMGRAECHTYTSVTLVTVLGTTVSCNKSKGRLRGGQSLSLKSHSLQRTCPGALPHTLLGWCSLPLCQNKSFKEESGRPFRAEFRDRQPGNLVEGLCLGKWGACVQRGPGLPPLHGLVQMCLV